MAGLSDALTNTQTQATTLPSWYTSAQQSVVNQAQQAPSPQLAQTAGGQAALGAFQTGQPMSQAASMLGQIGSGAINPWTVTTGPGGEQNVKPNVATPMGGLFKSQTDYLTSMMPEISAAPTGRSIAGGQFGSSSNEAAVARARAQAINQLFQQQNQAALQAQQTGASAAGALGTLGGNQLQGALNLATAEQADPFVSAINRANIIAKLQNQPTSQTTSTKLGALNQLGALGSLATGGMKALNDQYMTDANGRLVLGADGKPVMKQGLLSQLGISGGLGNALSRAFSGTDTGTSLIANPATSEQPGFGWQYYNNGTAIDPQGNYYYGGQLVYSPSSGDGGGGYYDAYGTSEGE